MRNKFWDFLYHFCVGIEGLFYEIAIMVAGGLFLIVLWFMLSHFPLFSSIVIFVIWMASAGKSALWIASLYERYINKNDHNFK
jgi:hypothetical protein